MDPGMDFNCTAYRVKKYDSFSFFFLSFLEQKAKEVYELLLLLSEMENNSLNICTKSFSYKAMLWQNFQDVINWNLKIERQRLAKEQRSNILSCYLLLARFEFKTVEKQAE